MISEIIGAVKKGRKEFFENFGLEGMEIKPLNSKLPDFF